jgi:hypothetical protein
MGTLFKLFVGFWVVWLLWYVTGGPLRDDKTKPYIGPNGSTGQLETFGTTTKR